MKNVGINVTESSILLVSCIVCYVSLPFNHTFYIDGQRRMVELKYQKRKL